jgi:hypothetical protein
MHKRNWFALAAGAAVLAITTTAVAARDFGTKVEQQVHAQSRSQFGFNGALTGSSDKQITEEQALQHPEMLATVAMSLSVSVVTDGIAPPNLDMSSFWPSAEDPEWLITCNEQDTADPGLVRINLATGAVATIVTGTTDCDPTRLTAWGTIVFGEEAGGGIAGGSLYELSDPINTNDVTLDRLTHTFSGGTGAENFAYRGDLGHLSFEGLALYDSGLLYFGRRPSQGSAPGGQPTGLNASAHSALRAP